MDDLSDLIPRFDLRGMDLQLDRMDAALHELCLLYTSDAADEG